MNRCSIAEAGEYLVRASDPGRRAIRILADGMPASDCEADSTLGPFFGDAAVNRLLDLAEGAEITTSPGNAWLTVRRASDGKVIYDNTI
jgi:hypothetical protein